MQKVFYLVIIVIVFSACEKDKFGTLDTNLSAPFISNVILDTYYINSDTILINGQYSVDDTIRINNKISVKVIDNDGSIDIKSVKYDLFAPNKNQIISSAFLFDNGINGDILKNDSIYSSRFSIRIPRILVGFFQIQIYAKDNSNLTSNTIFTGFFVNRLNQPPIISDLLAPDTISIINPFYIFTISIKAQDPNGQSDIRKVEFNSFKPDGTGAKNNPFQMYDDGSENQILPPPLYNSGDITKGDGIYTTKVIIFPNDPNTGEPTQLGNYRFEFQAQDFLGSLSNKILHTLYVRQP